MTLECYGDRHTTLLLLPAPIVSCWLPSYSCVVLVLQNFLLACHPCINAIFSVFVGEHIIWIAEQCKGFMTLLQIYHIMIKSGLIQTQPDFQALNLLLFQMNGAKIHSCLRALQGTDICKWMFFSHEETHWEYFIISFSVIALVLISQKVLQLESWAAK